MNGSDDGPIDQLHGAGMEPMLPKNSKALFLLKN